MKYSIAKAQNHLPRLVQEAEAGAPVTLTRRGKPVAKLVGLRQTDPPSSEEGGFWEDYQAFRQEVDLEELDIDPDALLEGIRDHSPGRDFSL